MFVGEDNHYTDQYVAHVVDVQAARTLLEHPIPDGHGVSATCRSRNADVCYFTTSAGQRGCESTTNRLYECDFSRAQISLMGVIDCDECWSIIARTDGSFLGLLAIEPPDDEDEGEEEDELRLVHLDKTGQHLRTVATWPAFDGTAVACAAREEFLVVVESVVHVYSLVSHDEITRFEISGRPSSLTYSNSGKFLAIGYASGAIELRPTTWQ